MTALVGVLTEWAFLFIWVTLMILSHVMHDIFIKLMVVPVSVVLGAYVMDWGIPRFTRVSHCHYHHRSLLLIGFRCRLLTK